MKTYYSLNKKLNEEVNTSNVGGSVQGEPPKHFGKATFKCDNDTFDKCLNARKKNKHWLKYLNQDNTISTNVKSYFKTSKDNNVLLQRGDSNHFLMLSKKGS